LSSVIEQELKAVELTAGKAVRISPLDSNKNPYLAAAQHILFGCKLCEPFEVVSAYEWVCGSERISGRTFIGAKLQISCNDNLPQIDQFKTHGNLLNGAFTAWMDDDFCFSGQLETMIYVVHQSRIVPGLPQLGRYTNSLFEDAMEFVIAKTMPIASQVISRVAKKKE
jgi:hypothetical protein